MQSWKTGGVLRIEAQLWAELIEMCLEERFPDLHKRDILGESLTCRTACTERSRELSDGVAHGHRM